MEPHETVTMLGRRAGGELSCNDCIDAIGRLTDMAGMLAKGDPGARLSAGFGTGVLQTLADTLNRLASSVQQMVDDSHEMAIGICEHYDTLNRIATGDLTAVTPEDSNNELIARLGQLINRSTTSTLHTIEELQLKDRKLREANEWLGNIIEFLPDATFVIDRDKRVLAWNRALEEMTGTPKEEMLGKGDHAYAIPFYGHTRPILIDLLDMETDELSRRYLYIERKGQTLFAETHIPNFCGGEGAYIWITASPIFDSRGERIGAIESVRDVSKLKRAEEENARLLEQLRQAQKMEAIGQLAGGIAHDFNNILSAIMGYGQMIRSKAAGNEACSRYGEQIVRASEQARKLTQDMLAFGRRQVLNARPVDLNAIVMGMEEMLQRLIREDIIMCVEPCPEPLVVIADTAQMQQVMMNLATNARDAMPSGGRLHIRTYAETAASPAGPPHPCGVLEICDTGCGMDEETRQRIFEPFFTTKQVGQGTGLGLSMAFGIIAQHGGAIEVVSAPQQGTTFRIRLPLVQEAPAEPADTVGPPEYAPTRADATILLVEDNDISRVVFAEVLEEAGYRVLTATDGLDAMRVYREATEPVALVILDVIMPNMNGRETLEAIIRERGEAMPHLFMSGYTADIIHRNGRLEHGLNYIAKPFMPEDLLRKVRDILAG